MRGFWREVEALDDVVDQDTQFTMVLEERRLLTRAARWLVRNRRRPLDIAAALADYAPGAASLREALPELLSGLDSDAWHARVAQFADAGVPSAFASRIAALDAMFFAFDIAEIVRGREQHVRRAAGIHFGLDRRLELAWLRDRVLELPRADLWQTLARAGVRDELYHTHRALTAAALDASSIASDDGAAIEAWLQARGATLERYLGILKQVRATPGNDLTTLSVAVRELAKLIPSNEN
jgi:glutamate dehydrogenase